MSGEPVMQDIPITNGAHPGGSVVNDSIGNGHPADDDAPASSGTPSDDTPVESPRQEGPVILDVENLPPRTSPASAKPGFRQQLTAWWSARNAPQASGLMNSVGDILVAISGWLGTEDKPDMNKVYAGAGGLLNSVFWMFHKEHRGAKAILDGDEAIDGPNDGIWRGINRVIDGKPRVMGLRPLLKDFFARAEQSQAGAEAASPPEGTPSRFDFSMLDAEIEAARKLSPLQKLEEKFREQGEELGSLTMAAGSVFMTRSGYDRSDQEGNRRINWGTFLNGALNVASYSALTVLRPSEKERPADSKNPLKEAADDLKYSPRRASANVGKATTLLGFAGGLIDIYHGIFTKTTGRMKAVLSGVIQNIAGVFYLLGEDEFNFFDKTAENRPTAAERGGLFKRTADAVKRMFSDEASRNPGLECKQNRDGIIECVAQTIKDLENQHHVTLSEQEKSLLAEKVSTLMHLWNDRLAKGLARHADGVERLKGKEGAALIKEHVDMALAHSSLHTARNCQDLRPHPCNSFHRPGGRFRSGHIPRLKS